MSTLKASRSDNYYFPPEYDSVGGSINKFQKSHPLGVRAKKIDEGILVVRYETPYHVRCLECKNMIGKGVRFNAEKKAVGKYYSTKIWEFTMKCPSCKNKIVCRTDPENCQYVYKEGAYKTLDTDKATDMEKMPDMQEKIKNQDPLVQLENEVTDIIKAEQKKPQIEQLQQMRDNQFNDDFEINLKMRRKFKDEKKIREKEEEEAKKPKNFALKLETPKPQDLIIAQKIVSKTKSEAKQNLLKSRAEINSQDIFLHSHINASKKRKLNEPEQYLQYSKQQASKAQQIEDLNKKLNKLPKSTQKLLKYQIKQNNIITNNYSSINVNKQ